MLLWNATTGTLIHTLEGDQRNDDSIAFSPDGKTLASEGLSTVDLWDATTGTLIHTHNKKYKKCCNVRSVQSRWENTRTGGAFGLPAFFLFQQ